MPLLYFLEQVVDQFFLINNEELSPLDSLKQLPAELEPSQPSKSPPIISKQTRGEPSQGLSKNEQMRIRTHLSELESEIDVCEVRRTEVEHLLNKGGEDYQNLKNLAEEYQGLDDKLGELYRNWEKLAQKLAKKIGMTQSISLELIKNVPILNEEFTGISLGKDIDGDVYISYISPESAMKMVRCWQKTTGSNLNTEISGIMSVCGNVAVKSYINKNISISFGCPDSREYGSIKEGQLVIGIPRNTELRLCEINVKY